MARGLGTVEKRRIAERVSDHCQAGSADRDAHWFSVAAHDRWKRGLGAVGYARAYDAVHAATIVYARAETVAEEMGVGAPDWFEHLEVHLVPMSDLPPEAVESAEERVERLRVWQSRNPGRTP